MPSRLRRIDIAFPKFREGRGFSSARILRDDATYDQVVGARTTEEGTHKWARVPAKWFIRKVAEWLAADSRVETVNWAGLPGHAHHELAQKYLPKGPGSVFGFTVAGSDSDDARNKGRAVVENVNLASHLANIGDAKTLVIHPASTTHAQLTAAQLEAGGVGAGLVRISVGIEDADDIIYDLDQALDAAVKGA